MRPTRVIVMLSLVRLQRSGPPVGTFSTPKNSCGSGNSARGPAISRAASTIVRWDAIWAERSTAMRCASASDRGAPTCANAGTVVQANRANAASVDARVRTLAAHRGDLMATRGKVSSWNIWNLRRERSKAGVNVAPARGASRRSDEQAGQQCEQRRCGAAGLDLRRRRGGVGMQSQTREFPNARPRRSKAGRRRRRRAAMPSGSAPRRRCPARAGHHLPEPPGRRRQGAPRRASWQRPRRRPRPRRARTQRPRRPSARTAGRPQRTRRWGATCAGTGAWGDCAGNRERILMGSRPAES